MPLHYDANRQEPYISLEQPELQHIRVVPMREGVEKDVVQLLGEPNVNDRLRSEPFPYTEQDAKAYIARTQPASVQLCNEIKAQLFSPSATGPSAADWKTFQGCSFRLIYDTQSGRVIGQIDVIYRTTTEAAATTERKCGFGYALLAEYRGKGIVTAVLGSVIEDWIRKYMPVDLLGAWCEPNNVRSIKILEKNGFEEVPAKATEIAWPETKGGGTRKVVRLERRLEGHVQ